MSLAPSDYSSRGVSTPLLDSHLYTAISPSPKIPIIIYPLPLSSAPGAPPIFNSKNATSFLKKYKSIYNNYYIQEAMKVKRVSKYYKDNITCEIKAFIL